MPRNDTPSIPANTYTRISAAAVTAIRVQNVNGFPIHILATVGTTAPTDLEGAMMLTAHATIAANYTLAEIWPGVDGANHVWVYSTKPAQVSVSHA